MKELDESEKKVLIIWTIVACIIFIILAVINVHIFIKTSKRDNTLTKGIVINNSRYGTVSNAINKYYGYINAKELDSILEIMDANYVKKNNITEENIDEFIPNDDSLIAYSSRVMYYKDTSYGVTKYYVSGYEIYSNTGEYISKKYYLVTLDGNTFHFSIKPISENDFMEVSK